MAVSQSVVPYKGVELDAHELNMDEMKAYFIRNLDYELNDNNRVAQDHGSNAYQFTPLESNTKYSNLALPAGNNYVAGFHYVPELNHAYVFGWNSNNNHFVYRINGNNGAFTMLAVSPFWNIQLDPKHFICLGRVTHSIVKRTNKVSGVVEDITYIITTDNNDDLRFFCAEDLIATAGFSDSFTYFTKRDSLDNKSTWFNLGVPTPNDCIQVTPIARDVNDEEDQSKQVLINYKGFQFRLRTIDIWSRPSEYGIISNLYFNVIGNACIASSTGFPRCLRLKFSAASPLVNQIEIAFRNCIGNTKGQAITTDWYRHTTIDKYDDCDDKNWWEREIRNPWQDEYAHQITLGKTPAEATEIADKLGLLKYNPVDHTFEYTFCADKECVPIDVDKTNRPENPLALKASTVFPLGNGIAVGRPTKEFEPLDCAELGKVEYEVEVPEEDLCTDVGLRKIEIWAVLYNPNVGEPTHIKYKEGNVIFSVADCSNNNGIAFGQVLPKDQEGIIGHLAGTDFWAISKQYVYNFFTGDSEYKGLKYQADGFASGNIALQKWEFMVPPGKYVFHVASHQHGPQDKFKTSSTNFIGLTALDISNLGNLLVEQRELIVDVCTTDYVLKDTPIMIWDLTNVGKDCVVSSNAASALTGYLFEDDTDNRPISKAAFRTSQEGDVFRCSYTDHNGYYFATRQGRLMKGFLYGYKNCTANQLLATTRETRDQIKWWWRHDTLFAYTKTSGGTYPTKDRVIVKGKIALCDNAAIGVPGVIVNLTNTGYAITDTNGEYRIIMHDTGNGGIRSEHIIISQRAGCQILACENTCVYCFENKMVNAPICSPSERLVIVSNYTVRVNYKENKGPKMGGRYGLCMFLHDWMGRRSYAQLDESHYLDIPSFQTTKKYSFSKIKFNLNGCLFPAWTRKVTFGITDNLNWDEDLTWVAERIQFIDNTGRTNSAAPTQIRLYYESLNEYNKQNDYSTNSTWQFLTSDNESIQGDIIEFIAKADGTPYDKKITSLVKYNKEGRYIQIDYTEELADLKDGTLIKLIRLKNCESEQFYYEVCPSINVIDGVAQQQAGYIDYYDSYILTRQIPVPVAKAGTTTNEDGEIIDTETSENQVVAFPFFFEHHSPSDTWGAYCRNKGRVGVRNPHERQRLLRMDIDVSNALANDGVLNGLHYFESKDSVRFDEQEWGGITLCIPEINTILVLCEFDNFITVYNDDSVSVGPDGTVRATSAENRFSRPERKIGNNFGCQLDDINTVRKKDGLIFFLDSSESALVVHNYAEAQDITTASENKGGYKSYISAVVKHIANWNREHPTNKKYAHGVIDPKTKKYLFTIASIKQGSSQYINDRKDFDVTVNDTIAIDIYTRSLRYFASFVPEYYGAMKGDKYGEQLITFRYGEAYRHHEMNKQDSTFNTFFGITVDKVIEVVYNKDSSKVKKYLWTEVYSRQHLFYIDRIVTESGQLSRLMPLWWERREKFFSADFKCDLNTVADNNIPTETGVNKLLDGDLLYGRWARVRYVGISAAKNAYCELSSLVAYMIGSEKSGTN
jgi:hypothetical protein